MSTTTNAMKLEKLENSKRLNELDFNDLIEKYLLYNFDVRFESTCGDQTIYSISKIDSTEVTKLYFVNHSDKWYLREHESLSSKFLEGSDKDDVLKIGVLNLGWGCYLPGMGYESLGIKAGNDYKSIDADSLKKMLDNLSDSRYEHFELQELVRELSITPIESEKQFIYDQEYKSQSKLHVN